MKKIAAKLYQKPFLFFLVFLLAAYLPVFLPFFHLKNDILTQNLPTRFVFGESIYSGFEPFWNPFLHYGNPQYGDMNNGFWNPFQWLIGSTTGYNIYTITLEEMLYILIGGWGIYKTSKEFFAKDIALITGIAYMCCGYMTGHLQYLCWITGTAFFPYVLLFFIRINKNPTLKNFLTGGISVFFFVSATHPGLIIGAAYFFAFSLLVIYFNRKDFASLFYHPQFWKINLLFFLFSCLLSIVVIASNVDVLQYISRGNKVSLQQSLWAPTTFQSYLSVFLPLPVHKSDFFHTDIAMRNVYIGVAHFTGLLLLLRFLNKRILISLFVPLLFFILLSSGGYFKTFAWKALPLTGFVRLNGEFTYFVILILLFSGAAGIQQIIRKGNYVATIHIFSSLLKATAIIAAAAIIMAIISHSSILFDAPFEMSSGRSIIKSIINNSSFWDMLLIQAVIQAITIYFAKKFILKRSLLVFILCLNFIIITWLTLPFTGLGMMPQKEVQSVINTFPRGIQLQPLVSINNADYINPADYNQFLLIASYSKKIGHINPDQYPVQLNKNADFIADTALFSFIKKQAFIFLSTDTIINASTSFDSAYIKILKSGPGYTKCIIKNTRFQWLTLLQNNYPYWEVKVNGKQAEHMTGFKTFISVPVKQGEYIIEFVFKPTLIKTFMWINLTLLVLALVILSIHKLARISMFK